ncbi:hypothetical protein MMC09_003584 [Bachmanniomyces sp. S44760]|nr:hypothetical protein [Bachmanniomyces sp. S44760]
MPYYKDSDSKAVSKIKLGITRGAMILTAPVWLPVLGVMTGVGKVVGKVVINLEDDRYTKKHWPKPLSSRRRAVDTSGAKINNAGLFARLPTEIRLQIYEDVLCHKNLKLVHLPDRRRIGYIEWSGKLGERRIVPSGSGMTNILRTCRMIYQEASPMLYLSNTFHIHQLENVPTFACFSKTIRPEYLASITSLLLTIQAWACITWTERQLWEDYPLVEFSRPGFSYPYYSVKNGPWETLWTIIATRLSALKILKLDTITTCSTGGGISVTSHSENTLPVDYNEAWVKPILRIRGLKQFEIRHLPGQWDPALFTNKLILLQQQIRETICTDRES